MNDPHHRSKGSSGVHACGWRRSKEKARATPSGTIVDVEVLVLA